MKPPLRVWKPVLCEGLNKSALRMTWRWWYVLQLSVGKYRPAQSWARVLASCGQVYVGMQMLLMQGLCSRGTTRLFSLIWEWSFIALFLEQAHLELARLFVPRTTLSFVAYWTSCDVTQAELFQQAWLCSQIKDYHEKQAQSTNWT